MLPLKVPIHEYRVLYFNTMPKKWPIRSLLLEEPDESEKCIIQRHTTEIYLVKPVMIHLHAVVWQAFEDSVAAGPSETDKDQRSAADEEYYSPEE